MPLDAERARRFHNGSGAATGIDYVLASTVIPEPINWLWENYLALRKITLLGGSPDVGKTLIATDVVARVTNIDMRWPTGEIAPTGTAVILSAEDTAELSGRAWKQPGHYSTAFTSSRLRSRVTANSAR